MEPARPPRRNRPRISGWTVLLFAVALLLVPLGRRAQAQAASGGGWAWGENIWGALGNGTRKSSGVPIQVSDPSGTGTLSNLTAVAAGADHSLALASDGTVWAWGDGSVGQLGNGQLENGGPSASNVPVQVLNAGGTGPLTNVVAIAAGDYHSLALTTDGTVWAWGLNDEGELGNGTTTAVGGQALPVQVLNADGTGPLAGVAAISAGGGHSLAVTGDGAAWAWGDDAYGDLGNGTISVGTSLASSLPVAVQVEVRRLDGTPGTAPLSNVVAVAAGETHNLALTGDGTAWAWGYGGDGELGNPKVGLSAYWVGSWEASTVAVPVLNLSHVTAIAAGGWPTGMTGGHCLALTSAGTVWAWGWNGYGELGDGGGESSADVPVQVSGLTNVVAIAAGLDFFSLAVTGDGAAWAWGFGVNGELGNAASSNWPPGDGVGDPAEDASAVPVQVSNLTNVTAIAAGGSHGLAVAAPVPVLPPFAKSQGVTLGENSAVAVTLTGSDPNSPSLPLTYQVVDGPLNGTLSGTAPNLTYTPNAGFSGVDAFQFTVNNGYLTSDAALVPVAVLAPVAPSDLAAAALSSTSIELTWSVPVNGAAGLRLWRSTNGGTTWNLLNGSWPQAGNGGSFSYTDSGLAWGTTYTYCVEAYRGSVRVFSSNASATPPVPAPTAPTDLKAQVVSNASIKLTWSVPATSAQGLRLWRSTNGGVTWTLLNGTWPQAGSGGSFSYTDGGLAAGTTFTYRVEAYSGPSRFFSSNVSATTPAPPAVPTDLAAVPLTSTSIKLTWSVPASPAQGFRLWRSIDAGVSWTLLNGTWPQAGSGGSFSYTDTGLTHGTTYTYRVEAYNSTLRVFSNNVSAKP